METDMYPTAIYTEQRIPQYRGNAFIEALPPVDDDRQLLRSLLCLPEFSSDQRDWTVTERMQMMGQLASFMLPMMRHVQLAQTVDALIRQGYVGRAPRTAESHAVFRKLYEMQKTGEGFKPSAGQLTAQLSASLLGLPGMGKTTTIKRILARYPQVIHHPDLDFYQVPYLLVETPYDGASVKGLAESIFRKLDNLFPDADYGKLYGGGKAGAETLMNHAARLIHSHGVGLLVVDEIQNLENSPKNRQALMTLLVSASNELGVPIMFVGTNKAKDLLSLDFRQARRATGAGSMYWGALVKGGHEAKSEWEDFIDILWRYQWVKKPIPLTPELSDLMYYHSQGIVDIAIKLFALAQTRALHDDSETLSAVLIDEVARKDMPFIQPMLEALRNHDHRALEKCQDIAPFDLGGMMSDIGATYSGRMIRTASILPSDPSFHEEVRNSLCGMGFEPGDADQLAHSVNHATSALDGVAKAVRMATSGKSSSQRRTQKDPLAPVENYPVGDYRNAVNPSVPGSNNFERLKSLKMLPDLEAILRI